MRNSTIVSFMNDAFLAVVIIWPVFQSTILPIAGSGQIQMAFAALALLTSFTNKRFVNIFKKPPILIWMIWGLYSIVNWKMVGLESRLPDWTFFFNYILLTYITLVIALYELQKNMRRTIVFLCVVFLLYITLGLALQGSFSFNVVNRNDLSIGNDLALVACTGLFVSAFGFRQNYYNNWVFFLFLALSIISSLIIAERKTFIIALVIAFSTLVPFNKLAKPSYWIPIILLIILSYNGIEWIMDNTLMGERFSGTLDQGAAYTDNYYLSFLGDRAAHYEGGWPLFLLNPITGIGLRNYPIVTLTEHPLHTEYMVQLTEGGIIGSLLFLSFAITIVRRFFRSSNRINNRQTWSVCLGELISLFLLCFITWTYDSPHYFIAIAIIIAFSNQSIHNHESITRYLESRRRR